MRLFVAAELPQDMLDALAETSAALRDAVRGRYVAPDSFHLTLAFLGEVGASRVAELAALLDEACHAHAPIEIALGELGSFGRARSAVLWQAVCGGEALAELAHDVRTSLHDAGYAFDEKPFRAHVTLMRAAQLGRAELPMPAMGRGSLDTVTLYRSDLSGDRPRYEALASVHLA